MLHPKLKTCITNSEQCMLPIEIQHGRPLFLDVVKATFKWFIMFLLRFLDPVRCIKQSSNFYIIS